MAVTRLSPTDWCDAALDAIAAEGVDALAVERLAPALGVSKGSFYWHFKSRDALLAAAALRWEKLRIDDGLVKLERLSDPLARLRFTLDRGYSNPRLGRIEAAFIARGAHPAISPVLRRVSKRRTAYLVALFQELGFDEREAAFRTRVAYGTYLGLAVVAHTSPSAVPPPAGTRAAFVDDLVALLTRR